MKLEALKTPGAVETQANASASSPLTIELLGGVRGDQGCQCQVWTERTSIMMLFQPRTLTSMTSCSDFILFRVEREA